MGRIWAAIALLTCLTAAAQPLTVSDLAWPQVGLGCQTNLLLLLDCQLDVYSDTNGTPSGNSDPVVEWRSQVNGYKFQMLGTNLALKDAVGPQVDFNITGWLTNSVFAVAQPCTVIVCYNINALPGTNIIVSSPTGLNFNSYNDAISVMRPGMFAGTDLSSPDEDINGGLTGFVVSSVYDGAASFIMTNKVLVASGNAGGLGISGVQLGSTNYFGDVFQVRVYQCALTTNDLNTIVTNILTTYGL